MFASFIASPIIGVFLDCILKFVEFWLLNSKPNETEVVHNETPDTLGPTESDVLDSVGVRTSWESTNKN